MFGDLDNVVVMIENQPIADYPRLYGLYTGFPITKLGNYGYGQLPDRIIWFQNNMVERCADLDALRTRIRITLIHEIGHYFGMSDERLGALSWA